MDHNGVDDMRRCTECGKEDQTVDLDGLCLECCQAMRDEDDDADALYDEQ